MSWIKIRTNLATDPAVAAMGMQLKMNPRQVVGCLVAVWCWADSLTADGFIPHATARLIDDISDKRGFANAMSHVGWLIVETGGVRFPRWERHNGDSAKARAGEAERKRLQRAGRNEARDTGQVENSCPEKCPDISRTNVSTRGEEIRGDINTPHSPPPGGVVVQEKPPEPQEPKEMQVIPPPLNTPAFRAAWADWLAYRRERKLPVLKPRSVETKLAELSGWGEAAAIASIRQSIGNGWHGLFPPKADAPARPVPKPPQPMKLANL